MKTPQERGSIENAIHLCAGCAREIDANNGADFPTETLLSWKAEHERKVRSSLGASAPVNHLSGTHIAEGLGEITGVEINSTTRILPGTVVYARGVGRVTGTKIG
jgi:hypothetical protein